MFIYRIVTVAILLDCTGLALLTPNHEKASAAASSPSVPEQLNTAVHGQPHLIPLRREMVPVKRKGKVVSFRTSYSGVVTVGQPLPGTAPQSFRVVFDTGSGHLILPSVECASEACLAHLRYNQSSSYSAVPINSDGSVVKPGKTCDVVNIGFGTGQVKGEFVRDVLCLGPAQTDKELKHPEAPHCVTMHTVMAIEMSTMPFKSFGFDGILGMGLSSLALSKEFSFFDILSRSNVVKTHHFGVYLTEGEDGEESEIAIGGHNPSRTLTPLKWNAVARPELGYWQVEILGLRVGGKPLDVCRDAPCRGVVDTGTSHLGIPTPYDAQITDMLTMPAGDLLDCRLADMPELEIELRGLNITLYPRTYMRRLPLREDVSVDSKNGVTMPTSSDLEHSISTTTTTSVDAEDKSVARPGSVPRYCRPRLMPVNMPAPLGPNFFILGEPVLHQYYTVFDWVGPKVGFGLANTKGNSEVKSDSAKTKSVGELPKDFEVYLMQQSMQAIAGEDASAVTDSDSFSAMQVTVDVVMRFAPHRSHIS